MGRVLEGWERALLSSGPKTIAGDDLGEAKVGGSVAEGADIGEAGVEGGAALPGAWGEAGIPGSGWLAWGVKVLTNVLQGGGSLALGILFRAANWSI